MQEKEFHRVNFSIIFPLFTISLKFLKWEMTKKFFFGWGFSSKRKCQDQSSTVINYRFFSFAFFGRKWFSPPLVTTVKTNTTHPFASVKLQEDVENSRKSQLRRIILVVNWSIPMRIFNWHFHENWMINWALIRPV